MTIPEAAGNVLEALGELTQAIGQLITLICGQCPPPAYTLKGAQFMYIVAADRPDDPVEIQFQVVDSEGNVVPDPQGLTVNTVSDNPGAVEVLPGPDPKHPSFHYGAPNPDGSPALANINVTVKLADGTLVGSFGEQFTVTPGDPAKITGGNIVIEGLEEA